MEGKLFSGNTPSLMLTQANHEKIGKAKDALSDALHASYRDKLFANNYGWSGMGLLASIIVIVAIAVAIAATYGSDHAGGAIFGMLAPILPVVFGIDLFSSGWEKRSGGTLRIVFGLALALIGTAVGLGVMYANSRGVIEVLPGLAPTVLASLAVFGFGWLQAPSVGGRKIMDEIDGFREYLGVAEEDRLEHLNPPDKTPELFERFLPYAVALDVENTWAQRFAGVLAAAAAGAAAGTAASWYSGSHDIASDPVSFTDHIGGELSTTIASASTAPGSDGGSGSGGGGSSGGGGGGGGGSGW